MWNFEIYMGNFRLSIEQIPDTLVACQAGAAIQIAYAVRDEKWARSASMQLFGPDCTMQLILSHENLKLYGHCHA